MTGHLADCAPCRAESDALKEVDRRLVRLGQIRTQNATAAMRRFEQRITEQLGLPGEARRPAPGSRRSLATFGLLVLGGLFAFLIVLWRLR